MIYRPGQIVPRSGQYAVVNPQGYSIGREVTVVKGEPFPPVPSGYGFKLVDPTKHWR